VTRFSFRQENRPTVDMMPRRSAFGKSGLPASSHSFLHSGHRDFVLPRRSYPQATQPPFDVVADVESDQVPLLKIFLMYQWIFGVEYLCQFWDLCAIPDPATIPYRTKIVIDW
jgi:hypothetical protein